MKKRSFLSLVLLFALSLFMLAGCDDLLGKKDPPGEEPEETPEPSIDPATLTYTAVTSANQVLGVWNARIAETKGEISSTGDSFETFKIITTLKVEFKREETKYVLTISETTGKVYDEDGNDASSEHQDWIDDSDIGDKTITCDTEKDFLKNVEGFEISSNEKWIRWRPASSYAYMTKQQ